MVGLSLILMVTPKLSLACELLEVKLRAGPKVVLALSLALALREGLELDQTLALALVLSQRVTPQLDLALALRLLLLFLVNRLRGSSLCRLEVRIHQSD